MAFSYRILVVLMMVAGVICGSQGPAYGANPVPVRVSMVRLLANPSAYEGRIVQVTGYLHTKFEDWAIYLTKLDADHLNGDNGFWVEFSANPQRDVAHKVKTKATTNRYFDCKMVMIVGRFTMKRRGHLGMWQGTISGITRVLEWTRWFDGSKRVTTPSR